MGQAPPSVSVQASDADADFSLLMAPRASERQRCCCRCHTTFIPPTSKASIRPKYSTRPVRERLLWVGTGGEVTSLLAGSGKRKARLRLLG